MKWLFNLLVCMGFLALSGCKKDETVSQSEDQALVASARQFFYQEYAPATSTKVNPQLKGDQQLNPRKDLSKWLRWENAKIKRGKNCQTVIVPINYNNPFLIRTNFSGGKTYNINDLTKLFITQDVHGKFHAEVVTYFPDSNYKNNNESFNGIVVVEDWSGRSLNKLKFEKGSKIKKFDVSKGDQSSIVSISKTSQLQGPSNEALSKMASVTVCYYIEGYNYGTVDNERYYWSEFLGCDTYFFDDGDNGGYGGGGGGAGNYGDIGGGGGGGFSIPNTVTIPSGEDVIGNINDYLKCFDNVPGKDHTYKVTVCVSQPEPGTRETWGFSGTGSSSSGNAVFVGHVFLTLTEITPNKTITRNVGFYPSGDVWPYSPRSQGQLNNDANQDYNISLTITTTSSQFAQILDYVALGNNPGFTYDLNSNNCTNFALDALRAGGINLPRTNGTWLNGSGLNPGDLGEDIRNMTLSSNMFRSTVYNYHPNVGSCY